MGQYPKSDMHNIRARRRLLGDSAQSLGEYEKEAFGLVLLHWDMIEAVVARLLKEETISGLDVDAICRKVARKDARLAYEVMLRGNV